MADVGGVEHLEAKSHVHLRAWLDLIPGVRICVVAPAAVRMVQGRMMAAALTDADLENAYQRAKALADSETPRAERIRQSFRDATPFLREFKAALGCGRLVICAQCNSFEFATEPDAIGRCLLHAETWPFIPFECKDFSRRKKAT